MREWRQKKDKKKEKKENLLNQKKRDDAAETRRPCGQQKGQPGANSEKQKGSQ
jgi:hypothetical protein